MTEADWIRWVGVIAGVFGAVVVAPSGALFILLDAWAAVRRAWNRFIRRKKEAGPAVYALAGSAASQSTASGALALRRHGAPLEEQVRLLWDEVDRLDGRVNKVHADSQNRHNTAMARIEQESADRRQLQAELAAQRQRDYRQAARLDARGLPLIGLGIVMTGVPDGLATLAWVGWLFIAIAALLVTGLAIWPFGRWVASRLSLRRRAYSR